MRAFLKGLLILFGLTSFILLASFFYAQFLVDHSLRNLELSMNAVEETNTKVSHLDHAAYRTVLKTLVIDEASRENVNFKNLSFLELALKSYDESLDRGGEAKSNLYLKQVYDSKISERNALLRFSDQLDGLVKKWISSVMLSLKGGVQRFSSESFDLDEAYEYSGQPLLDEARAKEKLGEYADAEVLYKSYLKLDLHPQNQAWIQISLADVLINQKKYKEAQETLHDVRRRNIGLKEADIAESLLNQVDRLKKTQNRLERFSGSDAEGKALDEGARFSLGLSYLATYDFELAEKVFSSLTDSKQKDIRQRALFYKAMILKMTNQFGASQSIINTLLKSEDLDRDLNLSLNVQLADIYYRNQELEKSLAAYDHLFIQSYGDATLQDNLRNAWMALAELEKASIYFFDMKNSKKGSESLSKVEEFISNYAPLKSAMLSLYDQSTSNFRDLAFVALQQGRIRSANELLKKSLEQNAEDAWTQSAYGTVLILLGKIDEGAEHIKKGYRIRPDEYTSSVLAYAYEIKGFNSEAEKFYEEALSFNRDYLPARFNIATVKERQGKFSDALKGLTELSEDLRDANKIIRAKTHNNLGCVFYDLNNKEKSVASFERALSLMSEFSIAKKNLSIIQMKAKL